MDTLLPFQDALQQQLAASARPGHLDVCLVNSTTTPGKLTFSWGSDGNMEWSDDAGYAVLVSVFTVRGQYRWDRNMGTLLSTRKKSRRSTGSQLSADARDGGAQCEATTPPLIQDLRAQADLLGTGRWRLRLAWTAQGHTRRREVTF